jgi:hypothetical protein
MPEAWPGSGSIQSWLDLLAWHGSQVDEGMGCVVTLLAAPPNLPLPVRHRLPPRPLPGTLYLPQNQLDSI